MMLFGRTVIETSLDPVPELLRGSPGTLVLNAREIAACETVQEIAAQLNESERVYFDGWLAQALGVKARA